jgi:hypothetical protein
MSQIQDQSQTSTTPVGGSIENHNSRVPLNEIAEANKSLTAAGITAYVGDPQTAVEISPEWHCPQAVAVACGNPSEGLVAVEVFMDDDASGRIWELVQSAIPPEIWEKLITESTPTGHRIYFRRDNPRPSRTLATEPATERVIMKTAGEGDHLVCAPTEGHTLTKGDLTQVKRLDTEEQRVLAAALRAAAREGGYQWIPVPQQEGPSAG